MQYLRLFKITIGLSFGLLVLFGSVLGQSSDLATIRGTVVDPTGSVIPGASVRLTNGSIGSTRETITNDQGQFVIANLPLTGKYEISVLSKGFNTARRGDIQLKAGETAIIDIGLTVGTDDSINVTVRGTTEGVQSDSAQLS